MDGFTYYNIFETKGIEYLAIIAFFAILIPFWIFLIKRVKVTSQIRLAIGNLTPKMLEIPQGLFFSSNHTWTHLEKSGVAKIGLDDMLLHLTGNVNIHTKKSPGDQISKGELIAEIEHKGKQLKILSPISGEFLSSNKLVDDDPAYLNEDPYIKGWIWKVKPFKWVAETNTYYLADKASEWSQKELERFKDFLAVCMAKYSADPGKIILQDGGELRDQPLSELPLEVWKDFELDFLSNK
ncbi:MAG TPA: hypothetical protein VK212_11005 [Lentimicrobium sp.]|nr:hypothetical protein [Lentimicrobium sp.]